MSELQAGVFKCGVRAAQFCAFLAVVAFAHEYGWWGLLATPVVALLVWAWQVLYENLP